MQSASRMQPEWTWTSIMWVALSTNWRVFGAECVYEMWLVYVFVINIFIITSYLRWVCRALHTLQQFMNEISDDRDPMPIPCATIEILSKSMSSVCLCVCVCAHVNVFFLFTFSIRFDAYIRYCHPKYVSRLRRIYTYVHMPKYAHTQFAVVYKYEHEP